MRFGEVPPPPTYPEYGQLLAEAERIARRPVDPCSITRKEDLIRRRGSDWCLAVLGQPCNGLGYISSVEAELLVLADARNIDPPLPQWVIEAREETARRQAADNERREKLRKRDEEAWKAAREACPVQLVVRANTKSRFRYGVGRESLRHAVPVVDAVSGRRRQHHAGRALCETVSRVKPLELGDPVDDPATCVSCLAYATRIRPAEPPAASSGGPDPDAQMVAGILLHCGQPMTTELLVSAANAYGALRSSREREQRRAGRQSEGGIR